MDKFNYRAVPHKVINVELHAQKKVDNYFNYQTLMREFRRSGDYSTVTLKKLHYTVSRDTL